VFEVVDVIFVANAVVVVFLLQMCLWVLLSLLVSLKCCCYCCWCLFVANVFEVVDVIFVANGFVGVAVIVGFF
jgi:hypothetical protein